MLRIVIDGDEWLNIHCNSAISFFAKTMAEITAAKNNLKNILNEKSGNLLQLKQQSEILRSKIDTKSTAQENIG